MSFTDLQDFIRELRRRDLLRVVDVEVDPELEVTEIATRLVREEGPALLFTNIKGARYPLAINLLATMERIEIGLGRHPEQIGEELLALLERINPPTPSSLWQNRGGIMNLMNVRPRGALRVPAQRVVDPETNLSELPVIKCWPGDGGRFITLPLVRSRDPETGAHNMGIYRMQVYDDRTTGMHMQLQKGGAFHHRESESRGDELQMAVALGGDPALILSAVVPLPEGIDEAGFAGVLRGKRTPMARARTVDVRVPANAEFVIEGVLKSGERRLEGPFGDHFGHYSEANEFPVFHVKTITRKRKPIYPATVVGIPPQEDRYMGDAAQLATKPLMRLMRKEVRDLWSYYESGFHNLLVVSVEGRYGREQIKTALGILGEGQLSLTKCLVLVPSDVDPSDPCAVATAVSTNFRPETDYRLIHATAQDTLDFTGDAFQRGSKMVIDATGYGHAPDRRIDDALQVDPRAISDDIVEHRVVKGRIVAIKLRRECSDPKDVLAKLVRHPGLASAKIVVAVSDDIDIHDNVSLIWGIFTRFDCAMDTVFASQRFAGLVPVYEGVMGIDATWKRGYPEPLRMDPDIVRRVDDRWQQYWK